jgi:hypothetical protein
MDYCSSGMLLTGRLRFDGRLPIKSLCGFGGVLSARLIAASRRRAISSSVSSGSTGLAAIADEHRCDFRSVKAIERASETRRASPNPVDRCRRISLA